MQCQPLLFDYGVIGVLQTANKNTRNTRGTKCRLIFGEIHQVTKRAVSPASTATHLLLSLTPHYLANFFFIYISFYCTTSIITDYKYTYVTINGLLGMHPVIILLLSSITTDWVWLLIFTRFLDHTRRRTTVGRTPLNKCSVRRKDLYLTTHNNHNRQTSVPPRRAEDFYATCSVQRDAHVVQYA